MNEPYVIREESAAQAVKWLRERGGIVVWASINLSNPGVTWMTPALQENGTPTPKPTWQAGDQPARHITSMDGIVVSRDIEEKRFHVAVRMGGQGLALKCTDASSRRIRKELEKAGAGSWYRFDYESQECIIMRPTVQVPLERWWNASSYVTMDFLKRGLEEGQ